MGEGQPSPNHWEGYMDKRDIGNLNDAFGARLDPTNQLKLVEDDKKGQAAYYNGQPIKYMDYIQEVGNRVEKNKGSGNKCLHRVGVFGGVSFDANGKIIN